MDSVEIADDAINHLIEQVIRKDREKFLDQYVPYQGINIALSVSAMLTAITL